MKIKLGIRGNSDQVSAIIIKLDDLMLVTADNLFLSGQESRTNIGKGLVSLLESLSSCDNQIEIGDKLVSSDSTLKVAYPAASIIGWVFSVRLSAS